MTRFPVPSLPPTGTEFAQAGPPQSAPTPPPAGLSTPPPSPPPTIPAAGEQCPLAVFSKYGLDPSGFSMPDEFAQAVAGAIQSAYGLQGYAHIGQHVAPHLDEFEKWLAEREKAMAAAATPPALTEPTKPAFRWNVPEMNPEWYGFCRRDPETGRWSPRAPQLAPYAHKLNRYEDWQRQTVGTLLTKFPDPAQQAVVSRLEQMEKAINDRIQKAVEETILRYEGLQQNRQYLDQNLKEFYRTDAQGRPIADPVSGQWAPPSVLLVLNSRRQHR